MSATRSRPAAPLVSIVVPAKDEALNLRHVLPLLPGVHEVIVVDGHSADDSAVVVADCLPQARFIQQSRRGKGNALACGLFAATGDIVVLFDADGSADPSEIAAFVAALANADVAKGSRALPGGGSDDLTWLRRAGNLALTAVMNRLFRTKYTDLCYGYNALWRDVLPALALPAVDPCGAEMAWGDGFEIEAVLHCRVAAAGLRVAEVPSVELRRIHGSSNLSVVRDGLRVLRAISSEWWLQRGRTATATGVQLTPSASAGSLTTKAMAGSPTITVTSEAPDSGLRPAPVLRLAATGGQLLPTQVQRADREVLLDAAG